MRLFGCLRRWATLSRTRRRTRRAGTRTPSHRVSPLQFCQTRRNAYESRHSLHGPTVRLAKVLGFAEAHDRSWMERPEDHHLGRVGPGRRRAQDCRLDQASAVTSGMGPEHQSCHVRAGRRPDHAGSGDARAQLPGPPRRRLFSGRQGRWRLPQLRSDGSSFGQLQG